MMSLAARPDFLIRNPQPATRRPISRHRSDPRPAWPTTHDGGTGLMPPHHSPAATTARSRRHDSASPFVHRSFPISIRSSCTLVLVFSESSALSASSHYVVFGGTGSVGSALASQLLQQGHQVTLGVRDPSRAAALATSEHCHVCEVDALHPATLEACLKEADSRATIQGVANCMGSVLLKPAHLTTDDEWHSVINVNLTSSFAVIRGAAKLLRRHGGSVVLVSSAAAEIGLSNHEAIAAAKAGISGMVRSAAATYAPRGIRFNAVSPGLVKSEMTRKLWETEEAAAMSAQMHALGRLGDPSDVADAIAWLLNPATSWVTGQTIGVDGGLGSVLTRMKM